MIKMSLPRALRLHITCPRLQSYLELEAGIQPEVQSSWILCSFSFLLHTGKLFLPLNKDIDFIWEVIMGQEASVSYACKKWWKVGTWDIHTDTKQIEYENLGRYSAIFSVLLGYWSFKLKTWGYCTRKLRRHITMYFGEFVSIDPFSGDWKFFFRYSHYQTPPMNFFLYSSGLIYMDSAKCSHWLTYWFCQQSSKIHCLKIHSFLLLFVMSILHVGLRFCFSPTPQPYPY